MKFESSPFRVFSGGTSAVSLRALGMKQVLSGLLFLHEREDPLECGKA